MLIKIDHYIRNAPRAPSIASSIQGSNTSFSLPSHLFRSDESTHSSQFQQNSIVSSISSSQKTTHVLSRELADEKIARLKLQFDLQRLQNSIAQIDQQYAKRCSIKDQNDQWDRWRQPKTGRMAQRAQRGTRQRAAAAARYESEHEKRHKKPATSSWRRKNGPSSGQKSV